MFRIGCHRDTERLPGNRLERLKGDRQGQRSIRIDDQWRIYFRWEAGKPSTPARCCSRSSSNPRFWLDLPAQYELDIEADRLGDRLDREVTAHAS